MKKKIWDLYAPIYEKAMRADAHIYEFMYERIPQIIRGKEVLEIATGPGLLAKRVAPAAKRMVATDYSDGMIREAMKAGQEYLNWLEAHGWRVTFSRQMAARISIMYTECERKAE